jgi:hypothetical protein
MMSLPLSSTEYLSSTIVIEIDLSFFHKGEAVLRRLAAHYIARNAERPRRF